MPRVPRSLPLSALSILSLALATAPAAAQVAGASESGMVLAHSTISAGGYGINGLGNTADSNLSQFGVGVEMTSATYTMQSGVSWVDPSITTNQPILAGIRPGLGEWDGNEPIKVFGFNFTAAGAGAMSLDLGSGAATAEAVVSNVEATATSPQGIDAIAGNPLAWVDATITNQNGTHTVSDGYVYTPAIIEMGTTHVGGKFNYAFLAPPGDGIDDLFFISLKPSLWPIVTGIPIAGLQGGLLLNQPSSFFLVNGLFVPPSGVFVPTPGSPEEAIIPNNPAFANQTIYFQGAYTNSLFPLGGAFTNVHTLTIFP